MKKKSVALSVLERERVRQLVKLATEPGTSSSLFPSYQQRKQMAGNAIQKLTQKPQAAPTPPTPPKPPAAKPVAQPIQPIPPLGQNKNTTLPPTYNPNSKPDQTMLQAFGAGMRQGVGNMTGGVFNFGRGTLNAGVGLAGTAVGQVGLHGAQALDYLTGTNTAPVVEGFARPFVDAAHAGASDMANSFGQYVGVRGAPTAVADMRTKQRAALGDTGRAIHDASNAAADTATNIGTYMVPGTAAGKLLPAAVTASRAGKIYANASGLGSVTGMLGNAIVGEGIVRPSFGMDSQNNPADNPLLFPARYLAPPPDAIAQTQGPQTELMKSVNDTVAGGWQKWKDMSLDPSAFTGKPTTGAQPDAAAQGQPAAAAPSGFSPEIEQFLADNNIQTPEQLDALSPELQQQLSQLYAQEPQQAASAAADPNAAAGQAAAPAPAPISPEFAQFLADNNIQTNADLDNLTDAQRAQFDEFAAQHQQQAAEPAQTEDSVPAAAQQAQAQQQPAAPDAASPRAQLQAAHPDATPEQLQAADELAESTSKMEPEQQQKLKEGLANPESETGKQLAAAGAQPFVEAAKQDPNNPPPVSPREHGTWLSTVLQQFNDLPPAAQIAIGGGLAVATVSMLSSLVGGAGLSGMLMGALGLGAAGLFGAGNGMFGPEAQGAVNDAVAGLVTMFGGKLPDEADVRSRIEAAVAKGPDAARAEVEKIRGELQPYANFSSTAATAAKNMENPDAFLHKEISNKMLTQLQELDKGQDGRLSKYLADRERYADPKKHTWSNLPARLMHGTTGVGIMSELQKHPEYQQFLSRDANGAPVLPAGATFEDVVRNAMENAGYKKASIAQSILARAIMRKAARCWAGYEPVPGTKAYTEGSCRPKGSKKTKKEVIQGKKHTEKKAVQGVQYRDSPLTADEATRIQNLFASRGPKNSVYTQNMRGAANPEAIRKVLEGYGRSNFGKNDAFSNAIAGVLGGSNVPHSAVDAPLGGPAPAPAAPAAQPAPAPKPVTPRVNIRVTPVPASNCPGGRCPPPVRPQPRPVMRQMTPNTAAGALNGYEQTYQTQNGRR